MSDKDLIDGLLAGNETIFVELTSAWYGTMRYVASSIAGDSIADEVIQETWISVMRALPKFERRSSLKSWVMRICSNEAKSRRRKESRQMSLEALSESTGDPRFDSRGHWSEGQELFTGDSPEALLDAEELNQCIRKHLDGLPEQQRLALTLREAGDYSLDEICNMLEVSSSNVRVLLHRARDRILQVIERFEREGRC